MKKLYFLAAALLLAPGAFAAPTEADTAFEEGNFSAALKAYQQALPAADSKAARYKTQLRITACQYMLGQYLQAAKTMYGYELPQEDLWKARFLLYRIHTGQRVKNIYAATLPKAEEENVSGNLEKWTAAQWDDALDADFQALWNLRTALINAPVKDETLILSVKDTDEKRIPTLFDFTLNLWKERLVQADMPAPLPRAEQFTSASFKAEPNAQNAMEKLAALLDEAARLDGKNRQNAKIFWRADRLTLPFDYAHRFEMTDAQAARLQTAARLEEIAGSKPAPKGWFGRIKGFVAPEKALYARAYAAYRAAQLQNDSQAYEAAVKTCQYATQQLAGNYYAKECANLAAEIQAPSLQVQAAPMNQNPQTLKLAFTARNIPTVYVRIYPLTRAELKTYAKTDRWNRTLNSWNYLTRLNDNAIRAILADKTPLKTLSGAVEYEKPYAYKETQVKLPALERGFYAVLLAQEAAFNPAQDPVEALVLNVTDLALFVSAAAEDNPDKYTALLNAKPSVYTPNIFRIYALDLKTGESVPQADLDIFTEWKGTRIQGQTNEDGVFELARKVTVNAERANNSYFVNPLAVKGADTAFTNAPVYFHFNAQDPVRLFAQTDRAIYRPGQKVQFSVQAFEQVVRGLQTLTGRPVKVLLRDANYNKIYSATLDTNPFGTAAGAFTLPQDALLGSFTLEATLSAGKRTFRTYAHFQVEEYKRPDYKVEFDNDSPALLEFGKTALVQGSARYYFGAPLQNAPVKYTIYQQEFIPPFFWWYPRAYFNRPEKLLATGQTQTDDKGNFKIEFTPRAGEDKNTPVRYQIKADVYDPSGRVITAQNTYKAARQAHFFNVRFTQGFYDAGQAAPLATVQLADINGRAAHGKATAVIDLLENAPDLSGSKDKNLFPEQDSALERAFARTKAVRQVLKQEIDLRQADEKTLSLPALPEGIYRLTLTSAKAQDVSLIFVVAGETPALNLPAVALVQHAQYYPGTNAKFLIGAGALTGGKHIELYGDKNFVIGKQTLPGGVSVLSVPVQAEHRGGLGLRWFGVSQYQMYQQTAFIDVPFDQKQLRVNLTVPATQQPGQKTRWSLTAKDASGAGVQGQASVTVYDSALDYYAKPEERLTLKALFAPITPLGNASGSLFNTSANTLAEESAFMKPPFEDNSALPLPQFNLQPVFHSYRNFMRAGAKLAAAGNMLMARSAAPMMAEEKAEAALDTADTATLESAAQTPEADSPAVRADFNETAYFNPALPVNGGQAPLHFTLPQSLTQWNVRGFVLTRSANFGAFTASTVTRKDFMVRLQLPRFLREGDKTTLQAALTNLTKRKITAQVELNIQQNGIDAKEIFGIKKAVKTVTVPAGQTVFAAWESTVNSTPEMTGITVTARAGRQMDAESKTIPVLPSKERLLASVSKALQNGSNTLELTELIRQPQAKPETAVLQINPSLALNVFNRVPQLLSSQRQDLLSLLNRYVPLAVTHSFYQQYPALRQAADKLPKRHTLTPAWDETDPLRLTLLEQTPWLAISQGRPVQESNLISLFEPETVARQQAKTVAALKKYQNADGAFTWLPGGNDDEYLTLYALDNFAQAARAQAQLPQAMVKKAYTFAVAAVNRRLSQSKTPGEGDVAHALYAAYVLTAFPAEWNEVKTAREDVQNWAAYADKYARFMTPLGQTYAAAVFHRLGQEAKAQKYLDLVLSRLQDDPLTGAHFAPEPQSWVWYRDTLSTQTATLQTLLEIRPQAPQTAAMARWLLFNGKATVWESPRSAAQAVFALLNYMNQKGFLSGPSHYTLHWGPVQEKITLQPLDFAADPRYTRRSALTKELYTAQITKQGGAEDFASLSVVYSTPKAAASPKGVLQVTREYFLKYTQEGEPKLRRLEDLTPVQAGDEVEVHLTLTAESAFDYVLLSDPKPAGFESDSLLSGWTAEPLPMYQENKEASTRFYLNRVPAGTFTLTYVLRPGTAGEYRVPAAQVQSMYAPEFGAHSAAETLYVN